MIPYHSTRHLLIALLLMCGLLLGTTAQAEVARLIGIQPVTLPGNQAQVRFDFTLPPPMPQAWRMKHGAGLVLDFWGAENETAQHAFPLEVGPLKGIALGQHKGRLRAMVDLVEPIPYRLFSDGNSLFLEISPLLKAELGPDRPMMSKVLPDAQPMVTPTRLLGMEFEHIGDKGRVILTLSDDMAGVDVLEEGNNVVVNLLGAGLSSKMEKQLEVGQFGTPLLFVEAFGSDGNASVQIKPGAEPYDFRAWQIDNRLVLEFSPERLVSRPVMSENANHDGRPMTVSMQKVSLRTVLQMITEIAGQKLVVSENVNDQVSLRLLNIPWRSALDLVMDHYDLELRQLGDVMVVLGPKDLMDSPSPMMMAGDTASEVGAEKPVLVAGGDMAAPMMPKKKILPANQVRTEMMPVSHRRASTLAEQLRASRLLSPIGTIQVDDNANMLVVKDSDKARNRIRDVLGKLDVIVYRSLVLQAQVITAPLGVADRLGVRWSDMAPARNGLKVGFRHGDGQLDMLLNQLDGSGHARLISRSEKKLQSGDEVSIERSRELTPLVGRRTGQYQDVVLSLDVMSRIQQGGRIMMDVNIARDIISQVQSSGEMSISNNELVSSVVVPDGDALVLTGFLGQVRQSAMSAADGSMTQSSLGNPTVSHQNSGQDMELLIFITPILASNP